MSGGVHDLLPDNERKAITWVREQGGLDEVEKRLMPEGMEWPRFEDGEPVKYGDEFADGLGKARKCQSVELLGGDDGVCDALLALADEFDGKADYIASCIESMDGDLDMHAVEAEAEQREYARRIREACGEVER